MKNTKEVIGQIVNDEIKEKGSSLRQFAKEIEMKHPQVLKILQGQKNYTMDTLLKILDALDMEIVIQKRSKDKDEEYKTECDENEA